MAKKQSSVFECQHCGAQSTKWSGKCVNCGSWDSLIEIKQKDLEIIRKADSILNLENQAISIKKVEIDIVDKFSSLESELDIVLGGGIVPGGLYLIGGSPGVGKSTLLLKTSINLSKNKNVLYVSGEESAAQIRLRAERLGKIEENLYLLNSIDLESIEQNLRSKKYQICVIDSIQTMFSSAISSAPGSVSQVRECTFLLLRLAKELQISIFIIGHITKEGSIAGPRILEHMVDCVLYFEGDPSREIRILRSFKNRFGATNEIGIFEMGQKGLISAKDASKMFFSQKDSMSGSAISVILEGSRPIVLEIQALVSESSFPRRSATGFELNRLNMLLALLERKLEFPFGRYDVFINVVGGMKINETAVDLALVAAIISSYKNRPLNSKSAFIGEVSLVGDIREVSNIDLRLKELESYGFTNVIIPKKPKNRYGLKIFEVLDVTKILQWM
ncbi:DNA repair protein RadA [Helicobacter sp. 16-1353]|uniref:DNA repair protein RadA n=1 Tax=Helicobacter sp. 16-1353 TaxID=2004996 RepID=UPI000DCDDA45|nr:DNA repair protein RadA [Helicobacter sp. 16-1353]RAX54511.1 DNA repair protein RadA [Helicobacter sp. 16-1353]